MSRVGPGFLAMGTLALSLGCATSGVGMGSSMEGHRVPTHYAQSMDSATSGCLRNPACYGPRGEEAVIPWLSRTADAVRTGITVMRFLEAAEVAQVEQALVLCARPTVGSSVMSARYPQIRRYSVYDTGRFLVVRECVSITFYVRRTHREISRAVRRALDTYCQAMGTQVLGLYGDDEGDWQDLDDKGWSWVEQRFMHPLGTRVELTGASDELAGYEFSYQGCSAEYINQGWASLVTFSLPTEYLEEQGPSRVRELALKLAADLPFSSGHAGLSFIYPEALFGVKASIHEDAFRYPGLDMPDSYIAMNIGSRVKGAYWLTFLGQPLLGELGGVAQLRAQLHTPGTEVHELEGERAVVTLGEWPAAGDKERGESLLAYRELARVLEPFLYTFPTRWESFSPEDMRRWARRFLD